MAVEFSMLRDLWNGLGDQHESKRDIIVHLLDLDPHQPLARAGVVPFNSHFSGKPSSKTIESPARWSLATMAGNLPDDETFLRACMVKWGFRVKPDLVIRAGGRALCIEAKVESPESYYPSSGAERQIFRKRVGKLVSQTAVQRYVLEDVMGWETTFIMLSRSGLGTADAVGVTWRSVRDALDLNGLPPFMQRWSDLLVG